MVLKMTQVQTAKSQHRQSTHFQFIPHFRSKQTSPLAVKSAAGYRPQDLIELAIKGDVTRIKEVCIFLRITEIAGIKGKY